MKIFAEITRLDLVEVILLSASHRSRPLKAEVDLVSLVSIAASVQSNLNEIKQRVIICRKVFSLGLWAFLSSAR